MRVPARNSVMAPGVAILAAFALACVLPLVGALAGAGALAASGLAVALRRATGRLPGACTGTYRGAPGLVSSRFLRYRSRNSTAMPAASSGAP